MTSLSVLIERLADVRQAPGAVEAIVAHGQEAVPALRGELNSPHAVRRGFAAIALAELQVPDADELLLKELESFDYGQLPGPAYILWEHLVDLIYRRLAAGHRIDVVDEVLRALRDTPANDDGAFIEVRIEAIDLLEQIPELEDRRIVEALFDVAVNDDVTETAPIAIYVLDDLDPEVAQEARRLYAQREHAIRLS